MDTDPGEVPPRSTIAASASSREYPGTAPVTTTARPASVASVGGAASGSAMASPAAASRADALDRLGLAAVLVDRAGDHGADPLDRLERLERRAGQRGVRAEGARELARGHRPDVADPQADEQPAERLAPRRGDRLDQGARRELAEPLERGQSLGGEPEEVGDVGRPAPRR